MVTREKWQNDIQKFEADWWGDCANTYGEETKQIAYAKVMGLDPGTWRGGDHWPIWDFGDANVIDVGGGPSSMLLKSRFGSALVVDPCPYPEWTTQRYWSHQINTQRAPAEDFLAQLDDHEYDVALLYNVLQHTLDPDKILWQLRRVAKVIHLFEWVETPPHPGHPQTLHAEHMAEILPAGTARLVWFDEQYNEIDQGMADPWIVGWGGVFGDDA